MYVALRPMKLPVLDKDGKQCGVKTIDPGNPVPGVAEWSYPNIIAHLNLGWMEWRGSDKGAPHLAHKQARVIDMAAYRGDTNPRLKGSKLAAPVAAARKKKQSTQGAQKAKKKAAAKPSRVKCAECNKILRSVTAMQEHVALRHSVTPNQDQPVAPRAG